MIWIAIVVALLVFAALAFIGRGFLAWVAAVGVLLIGWRLAGVVHPQLFVAGTHGSLLDPSNSPQVTVEMQTEMAGFFASGGALVPITNQSVIQQQ